MNTETFLKEHDACRQGADFARKYKTLAEAWDACERPDWLLWAYQRSRVPVFDNRQLRLFACWCARQNWDKLTDVRSRRAVEVAESFANGRATEHELESARKDAANAYAAYAYAYAAAAYAAAAAAYAAAANAAAAAANAAAAAATNANANAAAAVRKEQAVQLKNMIANPSL